MGKTRDLFNKIRDTKGTFHANMSTVKGSNGMDLTEADGNPFQYSCLENPMDRGAWQAIAHGVSKSWTDLPASLSLFTFMHWGRKWQPTPVFMPRESQGQGCLVGCHLWGQTESDTTEATQQQQKQKILRRCGKNMQNNTKKDLHDPYNHDGVITHLEPDILECEVKWALGSITMNKASGGDGIPVELFQILKDDGVKLLYSICQ